MACFTAFDANASRTPAPDPRHGLWITIPPVVDGIQGPPDREPEGAEPGAPSIDDSSPPIPRKIAVNNVGSQCTWWCWVLPDVKRILRDRIEVRLNAPSGAGCFPTPRRVVRCPAWGNGPRVATGLRAPLGPGRAPLIEPGFAQVSQGSPPMGLQGVRAARMSTRPYGSGAVLCSSDTSARTRAGGPWPVGRRGGWRRASSQGWAPRVLPVSEATSVLPQGSWWPGTVGVVRC